MTFLLLPDRPNGQHLLTFLMNRNRRHTASLIKFNDRQLHSHGGVIAIKLFPDVCPLPLYEDVTT